MKFRNVLLSIYLFAFCNSAIYAQFEIFDLSSYKNPYYKRQGLDLNFNFSGSNQTNKPLGQTSNNYSTSGSGSFSSSYFKVLNQANRQQNTNISLSYYGNISNSDNNSTYPSNFTEKIKSHSLFINYSNENRHYFNGLTFWEIGITSNFSGITDSHTHSGSDNYYTNDKNKRIYLEGEVSIKIGKGRIEYLEDARISIYILQELKNLNRLSKIPDNEEILELSKLITLVKNKRFFDSRLHRIEELTAIDSFFHSKNLITTSDAAYFTTLYDYWDNSNSQIRISGLRYDVGIIPQGIFNPSNHKGTITQSSSTNETNDYTHSNSYGLAGIAEINYYKPINLNWQLGIGASLKYTALKNFQKLIQDHPDNYHTHSWNSQLNGSLGYYPNSRTYLESSISLNYSHYDNSEDPAINSDYLHNSISPAFSVNAYYYISPRLTLNGSLNISYQRYGYTNSNITFRNNAFIVSLGYKLF